MAEKKDIGLTLDTNLPKMVGSNKSIVAIQ